MLLGELLLGHLVALGEALDDALDLVVGDLDAVPLGLLQLEPFLDQLLLRLLLELRHHGVARLALDLLDHVLLQLA